MFLIYSPTISSGVSFDKVQFDKIFGVICSMSRSERDYHQMLRRVRKVKDDNFLILNYSNFTLSENAKFTTYEDMKQHCLTIKDLNLKRAYQHVDKRTVVTHMLDDFDENYIFNKAEYANSDAETFLTTSIARSIKKGVDYEFLAINNEMEHENKAHRVYRKIEELIKADDIPPSMVESWECKTNRI